MRNPHPSFIFSGKAVLIVVLLFSSVIATAQDTQLRLTVIDSATQKLLPLAFVTAERYDLNRVADEQGLVVLSFPFLKAATVVSVKITYVGKATQELSFVLKPGNVTERRVVISDNDLYLSEVQVNAVRFPKGQSNSSIIIGRAAIEQTFASSLDDVLRLLPGKTITNPSLALAKTLTMRETTRSTAFEANAAFGTAIIVDGNRLSNNANLQALNPGSMGLGGAVRSVTHRGDGGSSYGNGASDVPGNGFDLRSIPVDNIESVEVIAGVPSARHGDLTDGAVIVNRKAGITPYMVSARMRAGTTGLSASKGLELREGRDVVNLSLDYTNENPDRRFKIKSYDRLGMNAIWTAWRGARRDLKNTLTLDLNSTLDKSRKDPDEGNEREALFQQRNIMVSNRTEWETDRKHWKAVRGNFSLSYGMMRSYDQWWLNNGSKGVSTSMESGTFEGAFTHNQYLAVREMKGKPLSGAARVESEWAFEGALLSHQLIAGGTFTYDVNYGDGTVYDLLRPRFVDLDYKNDRPESFRDRPAMAQIGLYIEDNVRFQLFNNPFNVKAGLRYDRLNGYNTLSPRINALYELSPKFSVGTAFGLATKAPGMIHHYPGKIYFDYPLLSSLTGGLPIENIYLVHTEVVTPDNSDLKPSKSNMLELSFNYTSSLLKASLSVYRKLNTDGFILTNHIDQVALPEYEIINRPPGQKPEYITTGTKYYPKDYGDYTNGLYSDSRGIELLIQTKKIRAIATSFDFSTALINSYYYENVVTTTGPLLNLPADKPGYYGVYEKGRRRDQIIKSTISSVHHFSKIGLLVTIRGEAFWLDESLQYDNPSNAIGYYDKQFVYHTIDPKDRFNPQYDYLRNTNIDQLYSRAYIPKIYTNYHLRISKEINRNYRFSFYANNFLNLRPEYDYTDSQGNQVIVQMNQPPAFGAEVVLKF